MQKGGFTLKPAKLNFIFGVNAKSCLHYKKRFAYFSQPEVC